MAFDANAVFQRLYNWTNDKNNGINIRADRMDAEMQGFADGLSRTFLRDGSVALQNPLAVPAGSVLQPGLVGAGYPTTGLYWTLTSLALAVAGGKIADFSPALTAFLNLVDVTAAGLKVAAAKPIQGQPAWQQAVQNVVAWASTITLDMTFVNSKVVLGGATTFANPTGLVAGQSGTIILQQDATGGRVPAFGSYFKWPYGGGVPSFTQAANAQDEIAYYVETPTIIKCSLTQQWGA